MTLDILSHGYTNSEEEEYHHEIIHLVTGDKTLCGIVVRGVHWFHRNNTREEMFLELKPLDYTKRPEFGEVEICRRCARSYQKIERMKNTPPKRKRK